MNLGISRQGPEGALVARSNLNVCLYNYAHKHAYRKCDEIYNSTQECGCGLKRPLGWVSMSTFLILWLCWFRFLTGAYRHIFSADLEAEVSLHYRLVEMKVWCNLLVIIFLFLIQWFLGYIFTWRKVRLSMLYWYIIIIFMSTSTFWFRCFIRQLI